MKIDGKKEASILLAGLDPENRERILHEIASKNPELAQHLRKNLFSFEQILTLESLELQKVIRAHPPQLFALALRGQAPEMKKIFYSKLSERHSQAMEEEILAIGPRKLSDVKQAQEKIIEHAKELQKKGEIHLK